jgi:nicotinamidase-related amidase
MGLKNTALLVIDVTNFCCAIENEVPKYKVTFSKIRKMIPKLKKFVENYAGEVVYIKTKPWKKEYLPENLTELYKNPALCYYSKDKTGKAEEFYLLKPRGQDKIFEKNTYDAFSNPDLDQYLKKRKIKTLIITGVFGDGCVNATISSAFSKGYNLILLKDLIETTDVKIRQDLQNLLKKYTWPVMYGQTITYNDLK